MNLVYATRRSALALAQSRAFAARVSDASPKSTIEELLIVTSGDKNQEARLQDIGGKGLFIKELEEALLDGRAHFAVHSIKDVPADLVPGLSIACVPVREDPRDVLVSRSGAPLADLPRGARIGTSSLRRVVMLQRARPDLVFEPLRGNVDTRLRKVEEGAFDAIVLAYAGLRRLGLGHRASEVLGVDVSIPAIGQGALGIECRVDDAATVVLLAGLEDARTRTAVEVERAVMSAVEGNCRLPVAAHARAEGDDMSVTALLADPDGTNVRTASRRVSWPASNAEARRIGLDLGAELKARPPAK